MTPDFACIFSELKRRVNTDADCRRPLAESERRVSSRMLAAKSTAARLSVTLTLRQGRCTPRKISGLAVPFRLYSQS